MEGKGRIHMISLESVYDYPGQPHLALFENVKRNHPH